jgi:hypothetical protein
LGNGQVNVREWLGLVWVEGKWMKRRRICFVS